jgi:4-oxalocrotonate tautomerase
VTFLPRPTYPCRRQDRKPQPDEGHLSVGRPSPSVNPAHRSDKDFSFAPRPTNPQFHHADRLRFVRIQQPSAAARLDSADQETIMPLVQISLRRGKPAEYRRAIADGVHGALVAAIGIPVDDRFQTITEHDTGGLIYDPNYLGIARTDDAVFIRITLRRGRTADLKRALYREIATRLGGDPGVRSQDILVVLAENDLADWSFGDGEAQYLAAKKEAVRP